MPSAEHAADLERLLASAAKECEGAVPWFGDGLPRDLKRSLDATLDRRKGSPPEVAMVDLDRLDATEVPKLGIRRVVALSATRVETLAASLRAAQSAPLPITRVIYPFAVIDLTPEAPRVRELKKGLTAKDLQFHLPTPLLAGPDLQQMGT